MKRNTSIHSRDSLIPEGNSSNTNVGNSDSKNSASSEISTTKSLFHSKIFWVNIIALVCLFLQLKFGWVIDESAQMQILAVINIILRYFTKEGVYI